MDLAPFQMVYPELIISHKQCAWFGEDIQFYNFALKVWDKMARGDKPLLYHETQASIENIDGGIKSSKILGDLDIALISVQNGSESAIGLVRGTRLRREGEEDFSLGMIDIGTNDQSSLNAEDFEAPDFFSPEDDLRRELE